MQENAKIGAMSEEDKILKAKIDNLMGMGAVAPTKE
jgi:hypothetical protein